MIRSRYSDEELRGQNPLALAIQNGLAQYMDNQSRGRAEESRRRAAGQEMIERGEGGFDRLRRFGRGILDRVNPVRPNPLAPSPDWTGAPRMPEAMPAPTMPQPSPLTPRTRTPMTSMADVAAEDARLAAERGAPPVTPTPSNAPSPTAPITPTASTARRGIADVLLPTYDEQDDHGNTWRVDPNLALRQKAALGDIEHERQLDEIHARGVEDRATLAARPRTSLSFDERAELERIRGEERRLTNKEHTTGLTPEERRSRDELARRRLDLMERGLDLREQSFGANESRRDVGTELSIAGRLGDAVLSGLDAASATEGERARSDRAAAERDKHLANASKLNANRRATREQAASRAQELARAGKTREQIASIMRAEGYGNIQP